MTYQQTEEIVREGMGIAKRIYGEAFTSLSHEEQVKFVCELVARVADSIK